MGGVGVVVVIVVVGCGVVCAIGGLRRLSLLSFAIDFVKRAVSVGIDSGHEVHVDLDLL